MRAASQVKVHTNGHHIIRFQIFTFKPLRLEENCLKLAAALPPSNVSIAIQRIAQIQHVLNLGVKHLNASDHGPPSSCRAVPAVMRCSFSKSRCS